MKLTSVRTNVEVGKINFRIERGELTEENCSNSEWKEEERESRVQGGQVSCYVN